MVVKMLPKLVRRKDPIELHHNLSNYDNERLPREVGGLVGATAF